MVIENILDLSVNELAETLTHCFEGYIMPANFTGALVSGMLRAEAADLAASLIAKDDEGNIAGVELIARRGKVARVAAMAVAKSARRQGVGKALLERAISDAKQRGEQRLVLEVIEQNPAAIELYKSVGMSIEHRLVGFQGILKKDDGVLQPALLGPETKPFKKTAVREKLRECTFADVSAALRLRGSMASSWSMSPATTEQLAGPGRPVRCGDVFAVIALSGEEVVACRTLAFAKGPSYESASKWLRAMANEFDGRKLFMPAFFPEHEYRDVFVESGLEIADISQFQMALPL